MPRDLSQSNLHLAFLFSSPLIRSCNGIYENVMQLDYNSEIEGIRKGLKMVRREVKMRVDLATQGALGSVITEAPIALHFSGHGVENTTKFLGQEAAFFKNKGNLLLLEDENGKADYFFQQDLKMLINNSYDKSEVVFVSSCYS